MKELLLLLNHPKRNQRIRIVRLLFVRLVPLVNGSPAFSYFHFGFSPPVVLSRARSIMLSEDVDVYCVKNEKPCDIRHLFLAVLKIFIWLTEF